MLVNIEGKCWIYVKELANETQLHDGWVSKDRLWTVLPTHPLFSPHFLFTTYVSPPSLHSWTPTAELAMCFFLNKCARLRVNVLVAIVSNHAISIL